MVCYSDQKNRKLKKNNINININCYNIPKIKKVKKNKVYLMQDSEISLNLGLLEKKKQKTSGTKVVSFLALFKYADKKDKILMGVGSVTSMGAGVAMPFFMIFFSSLAEVFSADSGSITQKALDIAIKFFIIGGALWLLSKTMNLIQVLSDYIVGD